MAAYGDDNKVEVSEAKIDFCDVSEANTDASEGKLGVYEGTEGYNSKAAMDALYEKWGMKKPSEVEAERERLLKLFDIEMNELVELDKHFKERLAAMEPLRRENEKMEIEISTLEAEIRFLTDALSVPAPTPSKRFHEDDVDVEESLKRPRI